MGNVFPGGCSVLGTGARKLNGKRKRKLHYYYGYIPYISLLNTCLLFFFFFFSPREIDNILFHPSIVDTASHPSDRVDVDVFPPSSAFIRCIACLLALLVLTARKEKAQQKKGRKKSAGMQAVSFPIISTTTTAKEKPREPDKGSDYYYSDLPTQPPPVCFSDFHLFVLIHRLRTNDIPIRGGACTVQST